MRVEEIYNNANALYSLTKQVMFEKGSSQIYDQYLIGNLNLVLSECFQLNNMERMFRGKEPLKQIPIVTSKDDELIYEDIYLLEIIPLGLAAKFFIDDDLAKYSLYNVEYNNAKVRYQKVVPQSKIDAFTSIS